MLYIPFTLKRKIFSTRRIIYSLFSKLNHSPIIILGNQKSGTTAIAALLAEYTGLSVTLDLRGLYEPVQTKLHSGEISFQKFVQQNKYDFSRSIIKEPSLTFLYTELKHMFPQTQFIMIVRDPRSNTRSILNRLKIAGNLENIDSDTMPDMTPDWKLVLDGRWLGLRGETYIEMLAARWNRSVDVYLEHPDNMILVRYEDFVSNKVGVIEYLAQQLGLSKVNDISDKVDIQYQSRGNYEISWEEFFGAKNLARIERISSNRMEKFRYQTKIISQT